MNPNISSSFAISQHPVCHLACAVLGPGRGRDLERIIQTLFGTFEILDHPHEFLAKAHKVALFDMTVKMLLGPLREVIWRRKDKALALTGLCTAWQISANLGHLTFF